MKQLALFIVFCLLPHASAHAGLLEEAARREREPLTPEKQQAREAKEAQRLFQRLEKGLATRFCSAKSPAEEVMRKVCVMYQPNVHTDTQYLVMSYWCQTAASLHGGALDCITCSGTYPSGRGQFHLVSGHVVRGDFTDLDGIFYQVVYGEPTLLEGQKMKISCLPLTVEATLGKGKMTFTKTAKETPAQILSIELPLLNFSQTTGEYLLGAGAQRVALSKNALVEIVNDVYRNNKQHQIFGTIYNLAGLFKALVTDTRAVSRLEQHIVETITKTTMKKPEGP